MLKVEECMGRGTNPYVCELQTDDAVVVLVEFCGRHYECGLATLSN